MLCRQSPTEEDAGMKFLVSPRFSTIQAKGFRVKVSLVKGAATLLYSLMNRR